MTKNLSKIPRFARNDIEQFILSFTIKLRKGNVSMKIAKMLGQRFKETPAECKIQSHIFMVRGGYMKRVGEGIYSLLPPALRITKKIENIIREEMDKIGGQEVLLPVAMPATLWKESGRFEAVGAELLRFKDRGGIDMVLGMTHEEAAVHLARHTAESYMNYPFMIYQIQTKFRDEPRSRGGLIRVREFTMKDAYSFHLTQEDLEKYYAQCHKAYERIFARAGVPEVISVQSDSGMMGGRVAHEFMLITDIGEDKLVVCDSCDYRSNMEVAECIVENAETEIKELESVYTPHSKTIEDLCEYLSIDPKLTCKAVMYLKKKNYEPVVVFVRGDMEVNEIKVQNYLKEEIIPDDGSTETGIVYGFTGPVGLDIKGTILIDNSLKGMNNMVCGANKENYHYINVNLERDMKKPFEYNDFSKAYQGSICPCCGKKTINICRGIEVGNIFQLGKKYTETMEMQYIDKDGVLQNPIMGCYGIGVGRLAASVCEARHDENGPIWPMSIAPWQVHICAIRPDNEEVARISNELYEALQNKKVEVIFDDRKVSAGVMFADADLLGVPVRVIVSPNTISRGAVEVSFRDKSFKTDINLENAADEIQKIVAEQLAKFDI